MSDIFIRKSDGKEFELVSQWNAETSGHKAFVFKPKGEEKENFELTFWIPVKNKHFYTTEWYVTKPTAEAIGEAIKQLLMVIQETDQDLDFVKYPPTHLINLITEARVLLQNEQDSDNE